MRRIPVSVGLVVALGLVGLVAFARTAGTRAQDATPAPGMAGHPLVGAWVLDTDADDPANPPTLAFFSADGVYAQVEADEGVGIGAWSPTGPRTAELTFHILGREGGQFVGTVTVRAAIEVAADGQSFTAPYTLEFVDPDGSSAGEFGPGTATGTRIAVEPMGTPVGPFEALFGTPAATPAA